MTFLNNLCLAISIGFLTYLSTSINSQEIERYSFVGLILNTSSLIFIFLSVFVNLLLAYCRLLDFKITSQIAYLRYRIYEYQNIKLPKINYQKLKFVNRNWLLFSRKIFQSDEILVEFNSNRNQFDEKFNKMSNIAFNLGLNSWCYLKTQGIFMIISLFFHLLFSLNTLIYSQ